MDHHNQADALGILAFNSPLNAPSTLSAATAGAVSNQSTAAAGAGAGAGAGGVSVVPAAISGA